jgi:hypothetical protein
VIRARHHGRAAKRVHRVGNSGIVGGDEHRGDETRRGRATIYVFDHRMAGDECERFSGEAGGVISGRDNSDDSTVLG